jgi:hypothetical protein
MAAMGHQPTFYRRFADRPLSEVNRYFRACFSESCTLNVSSYCKQSFNAASLKDGKRPIPVIPPIRHAMNHERDRRYFTPYEATDMQAMAKNTNSISQNNVPASPSLSCGNSGKRLTISAMAKNAGVVTATTFAKSTGLDVATASGKLITAPATMAPVIFTPDKSTMAAARSSKSDTSSIETPNTTA